MKWKSPVVCSPTARTDSYLAQLIKKALMKTFPHRLKTLSRKMPYYVYSYCISQEGFLFVLRVFASLRLSLSRTSKTVTMEWRRTNFPKCQRTTTWYNNNSTEKFILSSSDRSDYVGKGSLNLKAFRNKPMMTLGAPRLFLALKAKVRTIYSCIKILRTSYMEAP